MPLFSNPALLLAFYDPAFQKNTFRPYDWSVKILEDFADRPKRQKRVRAVIPNGGGKSSYLMAPMACWTASMFEESQTAITSASNPQLEKQTMRAAKRMADAMNAYHQAELWDVQGMKMRFNPTRSMIDARKSDAETLQEGFHPIVPGGEFTILVDEAKSIPDTIWKGIMKWSGWTRRADVSSAGDPLGPFYREVCDNPDTVHKVVIGQCPHISEQEQADFVRAAGGPDSPLTRQAYGSEFAALAGSVVLLLDDVLRAIKMAKEGAIKHILADHNEAGLDLSGGGDETCVAIRNGNKMIGLEVCPHKDEPKIEAWVASLVIPKWNLRLEHMRGDAGGMGRSMIKHIQELVKAAGQGRGERMVMLYNQKPPRGIMKLNFGNRGTEMCHWVAALIRQNEIMLMDDPILIQQLSTRYYRQMISNDKIIIEPKAEAKLQGHPSPDRADSTTLCFENYGLSDVVERKEERKKMGVEELEAWCDDMNEQRFAQPRHGLQVVTLDDVINAGRMDRMLRGIR